MALKGQWMKFMMQSLLQTRRSVGERMRDGEGRLEKGLHAANSPQKMLTR